MIVYLGIFLTKVILSNDGKVIEVYEDDPGSFFPHLDLDQYSPDEELYTIIISLHIASMILLEIVNIAASLPSINLTRRIISVIKQMRIPPSLVINQPYGELMRNANPNAAPGQNPIVVVTNSV